jgi:purine/pyrimidine-nucleoside phosphorylase
MGALCPHHAKPCTPPLKITAFALHSALPLSFLFTMTTTSFPNVTLTTAANVYFDGKCVSHSFTLADGTKKSVGVVLPSTLTFNTGAPEIMECVGGACEYKLAGSETWVKSSAGEKFNVPGSSKFEIRVTEAYHYICHFG